MNSLMFLLRKTRCFIAALCVLAGASPTLAAETLRVLSWPGYVTPEAVRIFEQTHKVNVELLTISTDDELWARASENAGKNFDVMAVNTAELRRYISAKIVTPVTSARIPNTQHQLRRFRHTENIPGLTEEGETYAIPYTYSAMGLIYNRKLVTQPPTSMTAFWDPQWRGKFLIYNAGTHNFSFTALTLGIKTPFKLAREQFSRTLMRLVALRDNEPRFYTRPEEVVEQFGERDVALVYGNYGDQQVRQLRQAGFDVGMVIPEEGALAWLDCWAILRETPNQRLAEAWINYMLTPAVSGQLVEHQGLANTLRSSTPASMRHADKLVWIEPVEDNATRAKYWERILSGMQPAATRQ